MPIEVTMPRLSDTMERGTVVKWNVKEGDAISVGDVLADIETDKATMELESFDDGTVTALRVQEGQTVGVGEVIAILAQEGEDIGSAKAAPAQEEQKDRACEPEGAPAAEAPSTPETREQAKADGLEAKETKAAPSQGRVFASPLARRMAEDSGVDLRTIEGTGPSGRIVKKDVEAAAGKGQLARKQPQPAEEGALAPPAPPAPSLEHGIVTLSTMRATIARRLVESKTTIPHYQVTVEVEMEALAELRMQLNEQLEAQGVKLTVNDFIVRACALAMHKHPFVNSRWLDSKGEPAIEILPDVNIGVAIALPIERGGGLVVASLRNADRMGLRRISAETRRLADKARTKGLSIEEMEGATFTISNLGMFGVEHFTAIINPPNAAILAVGAAVEKPVVKDGQVVPGLRMAMTMSSDHRIVDGAMAAEYLGHVKDLLEKPATLLV